MNKKLISQIGASAILLTSLIGAAPASAEVAVLPSNANGTDNSGVTAFLCESSAHFRLPVPLNTDPNAVVPGAGAFGNYRWRVLLGQDELGNSDYAYVNYDNADAVFSVNLNGADVSNGATLTLVGEADYGVASDSFNLELELLDVNFAGGTGTATDPYLVSNAEQLNMIRCFENKYFSLTNDIDLAGDEWLPIYGPSYSWRGALDGRGNEIKNLSVSGIRREAGLFGELEHYAIKDLTLRNFNVAADDDAGALFGEARRGTISNLKILNATVSSRDDMGLLGGSTDYRSNFNNITAQGDILPYATIYPSNQAGYVNTQDIYNVGGLLGYDDADGTNWSGLDVDVDIVVQEPDGYAPNQLFENSSDTIHQQYFGGLVGESGESAAYQDAKVKVRMVLSESTVLPSSTDKIGGVFGDTEESFADRIEATVSITDRGLGRAYKIGGFVGDWESFVVSNSKVTSTLNLEVGFEYNSSYRIGGFAGEAGSDSGAHDIESVSTINIVRIADQNLYDIGGFNGYDDEGNYRRINSTATVNIVDGNGSNNSLGITLTNPENEVEQVGGFVGRRDDYVSYSGVSSFANVNIQGVPATGVGGFLGYSSDSDGVTVRDTVSRGSVTVPSGSDGVAAFAGVSGPVRFDQVLVSTKLNLNGSEENVGTVIGEYRYNNEHAVGRSRFFNSYFNSGLGNPADVEGVPNLGATAKQMKSAKFLKANGFDLVKVFKHTDGQWPTIRVSTPFGRDTAVSNIRLGRTNKDTSISVGAVKQDGARSFFVNMPNANARQTATLFVVRNGKKVKQIHSAALNGVGNWYTTSAYKLRSGDVLRVEINGVKVRTLSL